VKITRKVTQKEKKKFSPHSGQYEGGGLALRHKPRNGGRDQNVFQHGVSKRRKEKKTVLTWGGQDKAPVPMTKPAKLLIYNGSECGAGEKRRYLQSLGNRLSLMGTGRKKSGEPYTG